MQKPCLIAVAVISFLVTACAQKTDHVVTIHTAYGDMVAILYDETPKHKENFIKLVREHYYDSLLFHRVVKDFMIQGGDPDSKKAEEGARLGDGGPGYTIPAEINPRLFHEKGALSAARLGDAMNPDKASSGSQFYIVQGTRQTEAQLKLDFQKYNQALQQFFRMPENQPYQDSIRIYIESRDQQGFEAFLTGLRPLVEEKLGISVEKELAPELVEAYTTVGGTPSLDGEYTVFGKVISGLEVIDKIADVERDMFDRPVKDIRMTITAEEMPRKKIEKNFGYTYPGN